MNFVETMNNIKAEQLSPNCYKYNNNIIVMLENKRVDFNGITERILASGNRPFVFYEYEWGTKIYNLIMEMTGNSIRRYARELVISTNISNKEAEEFENNYHLQGYTQSKIKLGLRDKNGELLQLMTFGEIRFGDAEDYTFELYRNTVKSGIIIIGGTDRLFKYFCTNYSVNKVISYCDRAKFTGNSYRRLGFAYNGNTSQNYVWYKGNTALKRYQTMKHKLLKMGWGTPDETESEIMQNHGYTQLYDSGNYKFVWINRLGKIYIITNKVNNKVYIGQTVQSLEARFEQHMNKTGNIQGNKFYNAVNMLGKQNFEIEELEGNIPYYDLNNREQYYINKYNSIVDGYNTLNVKGSQVNKQSQIDNLADIIINEYYDNKPIVDIAIQCNIAVLSVYRFLERYNISREHTNRVYTSEAKVVYSFDKDYKLERKFDSIKEALDYLSSLGYSSNRGNFYQNIKHACACGNVAYNRYWSTSEVFNKCNKENKITIIKDSGVISSNRSKSQVIAKGKQPKPSKAQLEMDIQNNLSLTQLAEKYGRNTSTIAYWKKCLAEGKYYS